MKKYFLVLLFTLFIYSEETKHIDITGNWHLRVIDGMDVRKARAILDFNIQKMRLDGFDACNRIGGVLEVCDRNNLTHIPQLKSTRMACRQTVHRWVKKRLHNALKEGFILKKESRYGIYGLTLKSRSHDLFLKRMGK